MDDRQFVLEMSEKKAGVISDVNEKVWAAAEPGYEETVSSQVIADALEAEGFEVKRGAYDIPTAIEASFGSGAPVIGILGEYDALPGLSQEAGLPMKKVVEGKRCGHGCGHSALGAGAAGAAIIIKEWLMATNKQGTVKFLGCPAEETGFGKAFMARNGAFRDLDASLTWHPSENNGCWAIRMNGYYKVRFDFKGRTSHAAGVPELGRSALDACELMNVGVNYLREHITTQARVHYAYLDAGGEAPNVVQGTASLLYFIRAPKLKVSAEILERVSKIARGAAMMTETEVTITLLGGLSDVIPNLTLGEVMAQCFAEIGGPKFDEEDYKLAKAFFDQIPEEQKQSYAAAGAKANGVTPEEFLEKPLFTGVMPWDTSMMNTPFPASSDVGDVSYITPTTQFGSACWAPGSGSHSWQVTGQVGSSIGNKGSINAAEVLAYTATKLYNAPEIIEKAKEELLAETKGEYICPVPPERLVHEVNPTKA